MTNKNNKKCNLNLLVDVNEIVFAISNEIIKYIVHIKYHLLPHKSRVCLRFSSLTKLQKESGIKANLFKQTKAVFVNREIFLGIRLQRYVRYIDYCTMYEYFANSPLNVWLEKPISRAIRPPKLLSLDLQNGTLRLVCTFGPKIPLIIWLSSCHVALMLYHIV